MNTQLAYAPSNSGIFQWESGWSEDLDCEQTQAVEHSAGPLLVVAGPGSGKTRVITYRIADLILHQGVLPENILAVTFTNKAAGEMRSRIIELLADSVPPEFMSEMWMRTIHSACARILRVAGTTGVVDQRFTIFDAVDCKGVLRETFSDMFPDNKKAKVILDWQKSISRLKSEGIELEDLGEYEYQNPDKGVICDVYRRYQRKLRLQNALDFDDLLLETRKLFLQRADIAASYANKFQNILIDEFQDVNKPQNDIVAALAEHGSIITAVGDPNQSIYGFRGAEIDHIFDFETQPGVSRIDLNTNYRSTPAIVESTSNLIANNFERFDLDLMPAEHNRAMPGLVHHEEFPDMKAEGQWIAENITSMHTQVHMPFSETAVLCRTRREMYAIENHLLRAKIPYRTLGGVSFFERREIKDIVAYARLIHNPKDIESFKRAVNSPVRGCGEKSVAKLLEHYRSGDDNIIELLATPNEIAGIPKKAQKGFREFAAILTTLRNSISISASEFIHLTLELTGYKTTLENKRDSETASEKIETHTYQLERLTQLENLAGEHQTIQELIEHAALNSADEESEIEAKSEKVTLSTIHRSKGLEYGTVFLTGMTDNVFPRNTGTELEPIYVDEQEERRVAYVAATRAKQYLFITGQTPSVFAMELAGN